MFRILLSLSLIGCAAKARYESYGGAPEPFAAYDMEAPAAKRAAPAPAAPPPPPAEPGMPAPASTPAQAPAPARLVHYQGAAQLRVGKQEEAIDAAIALAVAAGGRLESQYGDTVVLRVPVAKFQEVFDAVLGLGDLVTKSISAEDVTEAFLATELRLSTAKARRDRLVALLAQSKDEAEKLALVREIREVTEEIDRLEQQTRTLRSLADFSRITVTMEQRPALTWGGGAEESAAFSWIRALTPFEQGPVGRKLALDAPEGFVALDVKRRFVAESADGARTWSTRLPNEPVGSTGFWVDAVRERMSSEFAEATPVTQGDWQGLRFVDRSDTPYVWVVLVRASGKDLDVVQVFYPSKQAEERYAPAVSAVLVGGAS
jgi:hypothetical protein